MSRSKSRFVHLHAHSDNSQLDGCGRIPEYVEAAKDRGSGAVAFTEHGTMRGIYQLHTETKGTDIKPIYGIEFYVCRDMAQRGLDKATRDRLTEGLKRGEVKDAIRDEERRLGIRSRWHLCAWAKDTTGLRNLYKLSSMAWTDGFYYRPRIDLRALFKHADGLAIGTACLSGPINQLVLEGRIKEALKLADILRRRFGSDLWLELMPHQIDELVAVNRFILKLWQRWGGRRSPVRLIATQDAHYVRKDDWKHHEVALCIGTGSKLSDPGRYRFHGSGYHYRTRGEMRKAFRRFHPYIPADIVDLALANTGRLADTLEAELDVDEFRCLLPPVPLEGHRTPFARLRALCVEGWERRDIESKWDVAVYRDRLLRELRIVGEKKFAAYFLVVHDLIDHCRRNGIAVGPGRGSAAGSLMSYLIGLTVPDPIKHGLLFERFINPDRIDMPDIDIDIEKERRPEVIEYLRQRYGEDKVCQIANFNRLGGKGCLQDVGRVLDVPIPDIKAVSSSILEAEGKGESRVLEESFAKSKVCQRFNARYPAVYEHAVRLEGNLKALGTHAGGVITSPVPLSEVIPLEIRKQDNGPDLLVSALDMRGAQALGLLKLDVLGLKTMTVIRATLDAAEQRHGHRPDLEAVDFDAEENRDIIDAFTAGDYIGVFQFDTAVAARLCEGVQFDSFEDVVVMTALNRPGTSRSGLAEMFKQRKADPKLARKDMFHPKVSAICADTLGVMVYQEHVIKVLTDVAGYPPGKADTLRKKIGKSAGVGALMKERKTFLRGAAEMTPTMSKKAARRLFKAMVQFGAYGFNKAHATAYGLIAAWCMYLKVRYPAEFYCAAMRVQTKSEKVQQLAKDAKAHGVTIRPPDVSLSGTAFTLDPDPASNAVIGSLTDIKNVGDGAAQSIVENQPYSSLIDFLKRVNRRKVNKRVVNALLKAGALDRIVPRVKPLVVGFEEFWKLVPRESAMQGFLDVCAGSLSDEYTESERMMLAASVNPLAFGTHPFDIYAEFIRDHIKVKLRPLSDPEFTSRDWQGWIAGIVTECHLKKVAADRTAKPESEAYEGTLTASERSKKGWGKRYATLAIEDTGGVVRRLKVDWEVFPEFSAVVDEGEGSPVVALVSVFGEYGSVRVRTLVSVNSIRAKLDAGQPLGLWEAIATGGHPATTYPWKSPHRRRQAMADINTLERQADRKVRRGARRARFRITGLVSYLKVITDRRGQEMAFFGLTGHRGYVEGVCFGSVWPTFRKGIALGNLVTVQLERTRTGNILNDSGSAIWHKKSPHTAD